LPNSQTSISSQTISSLTTHLTTPSLKNSQTSASSQTIPSLTTHLNFHSSPITQSLISSNIFPSTTTRQSIQVTEVSNEVTKPQQLSEKISLDDLKNLLKTFITEDNYNFILEWLYQ